MSATILSIDEIVSDPKVRGGRPVIRGTGLMVMDVVLTHTTGDKLSAEEISEHYLVPLSRVYAALAYYHLHKEQLDEQLRRENEEIERLILELEQQDKLKRHGF